VGDREDPLRRTLNGPAAPASPGTPGSNRTRAVAGVLALLVALGFLIPKLVDLAQETAEQRRLELRDAGRIPPPFPERLVSAARRELGTGETWSLHTSRGACVRDESMYWLAFRLMPNTADCSAPDVSIYYGIDPPDGSRVVRTGRSFALVRR
jgi:hypothetical protein